MTKYKPVHTIDIRERPVSKRERSLIHRGPRGAQCKWYELEETAVAAANHADDIDALSWDILPMIDKGVAEPIVQVRFYDRADFGMCTFGSIEDITGRARGKKDWWFDELPDPTLDRNCKVKDKSKGQNWHPEYA